MRILAFEYGGPKEGRPVLRDSLDGLREIGIETDIIDLFGFKGYGEDEKRDLLLRIKHQSPDYLFSINYFDLVGQISLILKIPYIAWFGDNPHLFLKKSRPYPYCVYLVWDKGYVGRLKEMGFKPTFYLPLATNPKRFRPMDLSSQDKERYGCNISFVGVSNYWNYKTYNDLIKDGEPRKLYDEAIRVMCENPSLDMSDVLDKVQESYGKTICFRDMEERMRIERMLEGVVTSILRARIINSISELGVDVYGDDGWGKIVNKGVRVHGVIDYFDELPKLYNASKINLNITVHQSKGAISQRPFDISAAGGFCLSDYRWELGNLFTIGEEIIPYRDTDELLRLSRYYLTHEEERREVAKRARNRVLRDHTYKKRMEEMLGIIKGIT